MRERGTYKSERVITSPMEPTMHVLSGRQSQPSEVINFCANNYLGLSNHPRLIEAAKATLDSHGVGMSSVRFICGTQDIHKRLEAASAAFHGTEEAIVYPSCFDANAGVFESLLGPEDASVSDALNHASIIDGIRHPSWTWDFLTGGPIHFANVAASDGSSKRDGTDAINLAAYANEQLAPSLSWDDIEWFRSIWNGPIMVKGVQSVADARIAADLGIEAIAISNHGGRQLEGSPPPIELIAPVRDAIGDACDLICDGGIRRGADIVKALALGADATMGGRAHFFGLGAAGERGVELAFGFLHDEFRRAMALNGLRSVSEITPDVVSPPRNRTD